ncbi:MAG: Rrf2 family transcriptional regulator [Pirellulaceae bacterium]|jgi:Rrf2 family iron-sulfur cluster assembly transcriptional regulator|nr:Rrf2 family transcriptional regulator [Pirellulaceae bacterium]
MDFNRGLPQTLNMIHHKTTQNAIAAMSRLAELHADASRSASSRELAESRNLPVPLVAKILTVLSRNGLVTGSPGPGGGYRLAKPPAKIRLKDVAVLFERETEGLCAYGPGWCGHGTPCPLHDSVSQMKEVFEEFLNKTTFAVFENSDPKPAKRRASTKRKP